MSQPPIFRKVSLDRLSSPEQLDQLMQVTEPRGWIWLSAFGIVLLSAIAWSIAGSLPEVVAGPGMLIKSGGVFEIVPNAGGRVIDLSVDVGDVVREGQVVARIAQPELTDHLQQAKEQLAALVADRDHVVAYGARDAALQRRYLSQQRANLESSIAAAETNMTWMQERLGNEEKLVGQGLLTRTNLLNSRQQVESARQRLSDQRNDLTSIAAKLLALENQNVSDARVSDEKIAQQKNIVTEFERQLDASSKVVAPYTGRILEVTAGEGSIVAPGEPMLSLDLLGSSVKRLEAVLYVPSVHGKQIRPGMSIQIAPSTVKQEEYGLMLGRVTYVSDFPATAKGMQRVLKNDRLVTELAGQDAPYEVHADLMVDPSTPSQYRWSSSQGPPLKIQSGTVAIGNIRIATHRPIEMVIPLARRLTGI